MQHVTQRTDCDCGLAVAAMLADASYSTALAVAPAEVAAGRRGAYPAEIAEIASVITGRPWRVSRVACRPLAGYRPRADRGAVVLMRPIDRWAHIVAYETELIPGRSSRAGRLIIHDPLRKTGSCVSCYTWRRRPVVRLIWSI